MKTNLVKGKYVLACSAGIDSMVLLDLLVKEQNEVVIAHFNHLTRGKDNDLDYEIIKEYAKCHNLKVYYQEFDFSHSKENFHDEAHNRRYQFFYEVCKKENCNLVLAHHGTDLVETQILNYLRGSSIKGLAGFDTSSSYKDITIFRPLINYKKEDIINYQKEHNIRYNEDYSNSHDDYTRNRIRHFVIPRLEEETSELVKRSNDFKDSLLEVNDLMDSLTKDLDLLKMDLNDFNKLHISLKKHLISKTLKIHNININKQIINSIIDLCLNLEGTSELSLSNNYYLTRNYNHLKLSKKCEMTSDYLIINDYGKYIFNDKLLVISKNYDTRYKLLYKICYNSRVFPIILRTRKKGDVLKMTYGTKKLKSFLIDKKVSKDIRDQLLIIEINHEIYYVEDLFKLKTDGNEAFYIMEDLENA